MCSLKMLYFNVDDWTRMWFLCWEAHINKEEKIREAKPKYLKKMLLRMDF